VVYAKKPFRRSGYVLQYLGRYTHRVGIANSRLLEVADDHVTFATKNGKTVSLPPLTFLQRFLQHVLPAGFHKIRHYGLYASANVCGILAIARNLLTPAPQTSSASPLHILTLPDLLLKLTGRDVRRCPLCGGPLQCQALAPTSSRSPPARAAA
jgi:hypothetical protein